MTTFLKRLLTTFRVFGCASNLYADLPRKADGLERVTQALVLPPGVPEHKQIVKGEPKVVKVRLEVEEKEIELGDGTFVQAMTFNGSVPGPLIIVHQDDYVELTLVNSAENVFLHNIDFHASTGAMGGGDLTKVAPGQETVIRFKATRSGVFVYHCAPGGAMVPFHVVSGMNSAIMVLPRDGLRDAEGESIQYDRAYYIGEQDFYVPRDAQGTYKRYGSIAESMGETIAVMRSLIPSHVVFNGSIGSMTGEDALTSKVGEKVLFIHAQANRDSRPHLIGGHGDLVWRGGSFADRPATNLETWFVPGGTAVAMLYEFRQPGHYAYLNHNLIEAFLLGAAAHVHVEGEWNNDLMEQIDPPTQIK